MSTLSMNIELKNLIYIFAGFGIILYFAAGLLFKLLAIAVGAFFIFKGSSGSMYRGTVFRTFSSRFNRPF